MLDRPQLNRELACDQEISPLQASVKYRNSELISAHFMYYPLEFHQGCRAEHLSVFLVFLILKSIGSKAFSLTSLFSSLKVLNKIMLFEYSVGASFSTIIANLDQHLNMAD